MPSDVNSSHIVIKRKWAWWGSFWSWIVLVDGQHVGTLPNAGSLTVQAAPGHHNIVTGPSSILQGLGPSQPFSFDAEAGERIDLVTRARMWGRPKIWCPNVQPDPPRRSAKS